MVSKTKIKTEINRLESLYNKSLLSKKTSENNDPNFFAKLLLIEVCGWIEEYMDDIVDTLKLKIKNKENIEFIKKIKDNTYSFDYKKFKRMLVNIIGIVNMEFIENTMDKRDLTKFKSSLKVLNKSRNAHAHSFIGGTATTIYAPSFIRPHFEPIVNNLEAIKKIVKTIKY